MVVKPKMYQAVVTETVLVSRKVIKLTLKTIEPDSINFIAGQFVNLKCSDKAYRSYSIMSDYKINKSIALLIECAHNGVGSNFVKNAKIGQTVYFIGPSGHFHLGEPLPEKLCFYATGTGIAPFLAMFYRLEDIAYKGEIKIFFGARRESEVLEVSLMDTFKRTLNLNYEICYSRPEQTGHSKKYITEDIVKNIDPKARYFVCGHPQMVTDVVLLLTGNKINQEDIIIENFTWKLH